jgi:hypothetical protein
VEFEFNQVYQLADVTIWNYNEATYYTQGWKHLAVQVSETGGANASDWTTVYNGLLPLAPGAGAAPTVPSMVLGLNGVLAKYVTLINTGLLDEESWLGYGSSHAGLSEVRFSAVPEPGTLALVLNGAIGLFAYAWRKRR